MGEATPSSLEVASPCGSAIWLRVLTTSYQLATRLAESDVGSPTQAPWYAVILHWGEIKDTAACLNSIAPLGFAKVVVVDNGTDATELADLVRGKARAQLVRRAANGGYAAGNNDGLRMAREEGAKFVAVLNNDATVEYPAMLGDAEAAFRDCALLGALSPTILVGSSRWAEQPVSSRFQGILLGHARGPQGPASATLPATLRPTPAFAGCCWMAPTKVFSEVGLLREDLFLYHEELEFAVRLKRAGFLCARLGADGGHICHRGGTALGLSPSQAYYCSRNLVRVLDGFPPHVRSILLAAAFGSAASLALRCLAAGRPLGAARCAQGFMDGLRGRRGERGHRETGGRW